MNIKNHFRIGFVGLGLIGGSIAKSIRRIFPTYEILAYDADSTTLLQALKDNTITIALDKFDDRFAVCNYLFLCAPVHYNIEYLASIKKWITQNCIITDVGSVKNDIYQAIETIGLSSHFIGGHPMVGSERSGYEASNDRLIENAYYFLTPSNSISADRIEDFQTFISDLGAITILYSPTEHDRITAYISHIPHIIAAGLVNLVADSDDENGINRQLAAGGFKDITRIASSNPVIWEHILLSNPNNIINGLEHYILELQNMIAAIKTNDTSSIHNFFSSARAYRDAVPDYATGVIRTTYEVFVDVPDEPGALANVVTQLASSSINLKNVGITHNREDNEGVLRLAFYKDSDAIFACNLLRQQGYAVYER